LDLRFAAGKKRDRSDGRTAAPISSSYSGAAS
jgi:hypothetical protein